MRASAMFQHLQRTRHFAHRRGLAAVAVFVYIPFVSGYAFWFMVAAYIMLAGHRA
jgi:hypothetical protein